MMNKFLTVFDLAKTYFSRFNIAYFFSQPADTITFWFLLTALVVFVLFVLVYAIYLNSKSKKIKPYETYSKTFFWYNLFLVISAFINLFGRYENLPLLSWRFWMYLILVIVIAFNGWFFVVRRDRLEEEIEAYTEKARKDKWFKKKK